MAASILPLPGSKHGPCDVTCQHKDCAATRLMAEKVCGFCKQPIGFDVEFYTDPDNREELVHAECFEDSLEFNR